METENKYIKYKTEEREYGIDIKKVYYINGKRVSSQYDRTYFFSDNKDKNKARKEAQRWCSLWDGETFQVGADISQLDSFCDLIGCCPIENGRDFQCSLICFKSNCGAVKVMCPNCRTRYYNSSGCWQYGHNEPTSCQCSEQSNS